MTHGCTGQLWAGDWRLTERAFAARGGVLSDGFALLLPPFFEGRGDTREKKRLFALGGGPFVLQSVRGKDNYSIKKSSGWGSIFMKSQGKNDPC